MASNFLIGYADIPFRAGAASASGTAATGYGSDKLVTGSRAEYFALATATTTTQTFAYDLGSGVTSTANYLAICNAKLLKRGATVTVALSNGGGAVLAAQTLNFSSLTGPQSDDYITSFATSSTNRNWTVTITASTACKFEHSKHYFGTLFDMGREPLYTFPTKREKENGRVRVPPYVYELRWEGITDAVVQSLNSSIMRYRDINPVLLYDANNYVLNGFTSMHAQIIDHKIEAATVNQYNVTITFEQLI